MFAHHFPGVGYLLQKYGNPLSKDPLWLVLLSVSFFGIFFIAAESAAFWTSTSPPDAQSVLLNIMAAGGAWMFGELSWVSFQFFKGEEIFGFGGVYAWTRTEDTESA